MSYTISQKPDSPIIIATFTDPFDAVNDGGAVAGYLLDALNNISGNVYYIADMSTIKIDFSDLVMGLAAAYTTPGSPYANPRLKTYTVAHDDLIEFGAKAATEQQQYGKVEVKFYRDVTEALEAIRAVTAGSK
ncbi:MAG: hypothetical protein MUF38_07365 [Anaerolineae bacterium]|nr:hypothetical protein [Anaerolineae bacterium]